MFLEDLENYYKAAELRELAKEIYLRAAAQHLHEVVLGDRANIPSPRVDTAFDLAQNWVNYEKG